MDDSTVGGGELEDLRLAQSFQSSDRNECTGMSSSPSRLADVPGRDLVPVPMVLSVDLSGLLMKKSLERVWLVTEVPLTLGVKAELIPLRSSLVPAVKVEDPVTEEGGEVGSLVGGLSPDSEGSLG